MMVWTAKILFLLFPVGVVMGRWALDGTLSLIALLFLIHSVKEKDFSWIKSKWVMAFFALWLWMVIRTLFADNPEFGIGRALVFVRYGIFTCALAFWLLPNRQDLLQKFLFISLLCVLALSLDGLLQFFMGYDIMGKTPAGNRITGPYNAPILGNMIYPLITLGGFYAVERIDLKQTMIKNLFFITMPIFAVLMILISGDRSPLLLTGLAGCIGFIIANRTLKIKAGLVGLVILLVGSVVIFSNHDIQNRQSQIIGKVTNFSSSDYGQVFEKGWQIAKANPLFGVGVKHYRLACEQHYAKDECLTHPHNIYIEILAETGIIGLSLLLTMIGFIFYALWCHRQDWRYDVLTLGGFCLICTEFWPLIGSSSFTSSWGVYGLWLGLGIIMSKLSKPILSKP